MKINSFRQEFYDYTLHILLQIHVSTILVVFLYGIQVNTKPKVFISLDRMLRLHSIIPRLGHCSNFALLNIAVACLASVCISFYPSVLALCVLEVAEMSAVMHNLGQSIYDHCLPSLESLSGAGQLKIKT
jgi:hypothetical protein